MFSYTGTAATMFCIGTALAFLVQCDISVVLLGAMIFIVAPILFCLITKLASGKSVWVIAVAGAFLFLGFVRTSYQTSYGIRPINEFANKETELRGVVASMPVEDREKWRFVMDVKSADGKAVSERVRITTEEPGIKAGDSVVTYGKLKHISQKANTTSFGSRGYYMRRGIYYSQFAEEISESDTLYKMSYKDKLTSFINITVTSYIGRFPLNSQPLIKGMILNNKTEIPDDVSDNMLKSGLYRYIYSPYIHISIIMLLISAFLSKHGKAIPYIIAVLIIYLGMNTNISVAWKIALFYIISHLIMLWCHRSNPRAALYLTVLITGIANPVALADPAFIISVTCTVLMRAFSQELQWRLFPYIKQRRISRWISTYIIITVGIYPLCSYFGYNITPWSFLVGTFLMPAVSLVYILFYSGFIIFAATGSALTLGIPSFVKSFVHLAECVSELPLASLYLGNCGFLFLVTFYIFVYALYRRFRGNKFPPAEYVAAVLGSIVMITALYGINDAELTFVNVGQGDCAVIKLPFRKAVMVDGGGSAVYSDFDVGSAEVVPFLTANGITDLESVVISHYDKDHTDGILSVAQIMDIDRIYMPDYVPENDYREMIEDIAEEKNIEICLVEGPGEIELPGKLRGEVVHFEKSDYGNDNSLVLKVTYGETDILFTGDISTYVEYKLPKIPVEILKVPHHGSKTSSSSDLIEKTGADYNVICVGENNPYKHPNDIVLERYNKFGAKVLRTDLEGDIHFVIGKNKIKRVWSRSNINIDKLY